jgi:tRNA G10  N-methylase Trm11
VGVSDTKKKRWERKALEKEQNGEEETKEGEEEPEDEEEPHYSMKEHYDVQKVYSDLLENASKLVRKGGRIVFLYHTDLSLPPERNKFPEHPEFEFESSSENNLTKYRARHLITMIRK